MRTISSFILVLSLALVLFGCGGEADTDVVTDSNNDTELNIDTTFVEEAVIDEVVEEEVTPEVEEETSIGSYFTVEDYATITTKEELVSEFGEENLTDGESWFAEGTVQFDHTLLTNPENDQTIKYLWKEDGNSLSFLEADYYLMDENYMIASTQVISSESGLSTGMTLEELVEWNGQDFSFYGFGWDYEGGIIPDSSSEFAKCPLDVKLTFDLEIVIPEEYTGMYSDGIFNTADDITDGAPVRLHILTCRP